ncbi:hypothetical protein AB1N83_011095 [Pleurotus pulmonarius]
MQCSFLERDATPTYAHTNSRSHALQSHTRREVPQSSRRGATPQYRCRRPFTSGRIPLSCACPSPTEHIRIHRDGSFRTQEEGG